MATPELIEKWERITSYLQISLKELPEESRLETEMAEEYLDYNELSLAYSEILAIAKIFNFRNEVFDRNMALAARETNKEYKR